MKKMRVLVIVLALSAALIGCGNSAEKKETKSLYEHGIELISLMEEMAKSDSYLPLYSGSNELQEIVSVVGTGNYTEPEAVYKISVNEETLYMMSEMQVMEDASEELKNYVTARTYGTIPTQINATGGANILAAASICTASKTFVSDELDGSAIYLYTYENAVPAMVTFTAGEDGAVSASSCFIFYEGFHVDNIDEMKQFLEGVAASIEEIER